MNPLLSASRADASVVSGKSYNADNGGRYTLNQVWDFLQQIEDAKLPTIYLPHRQADVRDSQADITAAFSGEDGLRRTLEWYRG